MMNDANEISHQTKLYGFIGEEAGTSSLCATLNKLLKRKNKDAMAIPMNIREDDFYFTVSNMKKSHVNGAILSNEFVQDVVEILDEADEIVTQSGMCDILVREGEKLIGSVLFADILTKYLESQNAKKVALIGINHYAKAFALTLNNSLHVSYFNDDLEALMSFVGEMNISDADINRVAPNMDVDLSSFDVVIDFSDFSSLSMLSKLSPLNIDMKQKKQLSSLKIRANELSANYTGFENILDTISSEILDFYADKNHLDYDKSDMRF
ncbi:hypothetical protein N9A28_05265 [Sulfurimonas sp.]|nr:hypothetical protein [Sulfurimonas sp.]